LRFLKGIGPECAHWYAMAAFIYICPVMGLNVQGWSAEDAADCDTYLPVRCIACNQIHHVNPITGKVLGGVEDDELAASVGGLVTRRPPH
jgi:hypothetical protein